jgi:hypothetical protein
MKIKKSLYIIVRIHMGTMVDISSMQRQNYVLRQLQASTTAIEYVFGKPFVSTHGHLRL